MTKITYIPGEIANAAIDEHGNRKPVTRTQHIFDDAKDKNQAEVNAEVDDTFAFHQSEINALNSQNYVTVNSFSSLPATGAVDTVYRVSNWDGTQQDPSVYSEYAWNGEDYVHLSTKTQIGEVFDISAYHATGGELAKYADLAAALGTNGENIPQSLQKGGMRVQFVHSIDNKYVQYRLIANEWSTNTEDWAITDEGIYVDNPEFIYVKTDAECKILFGIKMDGEPFFGVGCPEQIKQYIEEKIAELSLDELIEGIQTQLATKVDKIEGKGLSSNDYDNTAKSIVDMHEEVEDSEWLQKTTDSEDSFVHGIKSNGTKVLNLDVELPSALLQRNDDSQYIFLIKDGNDNYLAGIKDNGQIDYFGDTPDKTKAFVKEYIENIEASNTANPYKQNRHQIQNVYSAARYKANREKCLQMLFVADSHGYNTGVNRALEVSNNLQSVDALVHLGDIAPWTARQTNYGRNPNELEASINNMLSKSIKPVYLVCGNHDVGASRYVYYTYTHEEIYNKMIQPMINKGYLVPGEYNTNGDWADKCYYFHDFHHVKARLIVLYEYGMQLALDDNEYWEPVVYNSNYDFMAPGTTYTYDENNPTILNCGGWKENSFKLRKTVTTTTNPETDKRGGTFPWYKLRNLQLFEKNQMDWLIDRLNDTPDGYGVIIASHQGLMYPVITTDNNFSIGSNPDNTYHPRNATIANPTGVEPDVYTNVPIVSKIVGAWINKGQLSERVASRDVLHSSGQNGAYRNTEVDGSGYYMYKMEYDFSERTNNNAYFVGFVGGHEHCDIVERSVEFPNQVSVTVTTSEPSQRYMSDTANDSNVNSPSYDCITIYSCGNNRIALCKWGNAQTIAGKDRSIEIINPINN